MAVYGQWLISGVFPAEMISVSYGLYGGYGFWLVTALILELPLEVLTSDKYKIPELTRMTSVHYNPLSKQMGPRAQQSGGILANHSI